MPTVIGIDVGSTTGIVAVDCPQWPHFDGARIVAHHAVAAVTASRARKAEVGLPRAQMDVLYHGKLVSALSLHRGAQLVVLEEPYDGAVFFGNRGRMRQERGTAFRLGAHYALALTAAAICCPHATLFSYPVTSDRKKGRTGWMQGDATKATPRNLILDRMALLARVLGRPEKLPEHVLMALGVLAFHAGQQAGQQMTMLKLER